MKKNIIFAIGGAVIGGAIGFIAGKMTYKKKLDKAEMDIETLLKEINRPEEDSEVNDEDGTEEEETEPEDGGNPVEKKSGQPSMSYGAREAGDSVVDYDSFYSAPGYKSNYISKREKSVNGGSSVGVDPAERESPKEEADEDEEYDDYEDWSSEARPEFEPGSKEDIEYRTRQELLASGMMIDKSNEDYEAGLEIDREMNSGKKPRLITEESYYDEYLHHSKCILEYYTDNDVLVDTDVDQELDDPRRYVGDCLDKFHFRTNDEEFIIYVRNFAYGIDYEISKVFGAWEG